jgi:hypothetical protein
LRLTYLSIEQRRDELKRNTITNTTDALTLILPSLLYSIVLSRFGWFVCSKHSPV